MNRNILLLIMLLSSCQNQERIPGKMQSTDLESMIDSQNELVDAPNQILMLENRIDSLYKEIGASLEEHQRDYLQFTMQDCVQSYKNTFQQNAAIYREIFDNASGGSSLSDPYYYFYLKRYYSDILLLQNELKRHFEELDSLNI